MGSDMPQKGGTKVPEGALRIAFVRQRWRADGGAERFLARVLAALPAGWRPLVLSRQWPEGNGVEIRRLDPPYAGRLLRDWTFRRAVEARMRRQEDTLFQAHERIPGARIWRAGDGVHAAWLARRGRPWRLDPWHRYTLRSEAEVTRHPALGAIVCNARMVADEIRHHHGVDPSLLHVVPNPIDTQAFRPPDEEERARARSAYGVRDEECAVVHLGSGFERKGVGTLLRALRSAPSSVRLLCAGHDRRAARFATRARELGVADRVRFLGRVEDARTLLHAADVFALATLYDPFPNVVLEAMACALPVVVSDGCGARELVREGLEGHVVPVGEAAAFGEAFARYAGASARRAEAGAAARERVRALTPERCAAELGSLYAALLEARTA